MSGKKGEKATSLNLNTTNLELNWKLQDNAKTKLKGYTNNTDAKIERHVKWHKDTAKGLDNNISGDHWVTSTATCRSRPSSAFNNKHVPKTIAFMSKSGKISMDLRKLVRPATANACSNRAIVSRGVAYQKGNGRRISHSAGLLRMKERIGSTSADTEVARPISDTKRAKPKDAWTSMVKEENRKLSAIDGERKHENVSQIPEPNQEESDSIINLEGSGNVDNGISPKETAVLTNEAKCYKERGENGNTRSQMNVPSRTFFFEGETNKVKATDDDRRSERETVREGHMKMKVEEIAGMHRTEVLEESKIRQKARQISGLFRKSAIFVCSILRLQLHMTSLSKDVTSRSATEEQWHAVNTSKQVKELVFNKDVYAKSRAVTRVPIWARKILDKSPEERSDRDLRHLHALLRGLKSFDKFTEKIQFAMCRSFTYQWATSGRILLRQGHVGVNFYFIYSGSVFVNINDTNMYGNQFVKTEAVLKRGDSFGELALLKDIRRSATISCREDCELLVVDKDTFAKVCPQIFEEELEEKCDFLGTLTMFSPKYWTRDSLKKMCFEARIQEHKTNKVIVADSYADEWIYICMEGKASVIRKLNLKNEIEWRKRRRRMINEVKSNQPDDDDAIDMLGVLEARAYTPDEKHPRKSSISNRSVGKERLLTSMGLDYTKMKKDPMNSNSSSTHASEIDPRVPGDVPQTLTALIAREKNPGMLFLTIKTLRENDIFDKCSIFSESSPRQERGYILASEGCKVLRIQKKAFYEEASDKAIRHAKALAELERYPDDEQLLRNYMDHLTWITYRYSLFDRILRRKDRHSDNHVVSRRQRDTESRRVSAKKNARNLEILASLNQAFYEYDPEMRRVAKWKQMQEMVAKLPNDETVEYLEIPTDIRKHGSLIPEIQVNIRENIFKPKEVKMAKELLDIGAFNLDDVKDNRLQSISED